MKKLTLIALIALLSACSSVKPVLVEQEMLIGTWHCQWTSDDINLEGDVSYSDNGLQHRKTKISGKFPELKGKFSYDIESKGTWQLQKNAVYENMDDFTLKSLNELSFAFEDLMTKEMKKKPRSYLAIITIDDQKLNLVDHRGNATSCRRVLLSQD